MPQEMKMLNNPFKLLRHKIHNRDKNNLKGFMDELSYINRELSYNLFDNKNKF
jgi:hypothetical protein